MTVPEHEPDDGLTVTHEPTTGRFVLARHGATLGHLGYTRDADVVDIYTTQIRPEHRGHGLAAELVRHALDDLRAAGVRRVVPSCWYVADFVADHPAYQDLVRG